MPQYKICPYCGAYLDPDEKCDCSQSTKATPQAKAWAILAGASLLIGIYHAALYDADLITFGRALITVTLSGGLSLLGARRLDQLTR